MLTLIENGDIYAPQPRGMRDVLLVGGRIARIGETDRLAVEALGLELAVINTTDCFVTPGIIDPHEIVSNLAIFVYPLSRPDKPTHDQLSHRHRKRVSHAPDGEPAQKLSAG